jgi:hypothetical protein
LNQMLKGYLNYYAVSGNSPSLWWYFNEVRWRWIKSLKRRSQRASMSWEKFTSITDRFFPSIRILHGALAAHAGIRAGGGWQQPLLPRPRVEKTRCSAARCRAARGTGLMECSAGVTISPP